MTGDDVVGRITEVIDARFGTLEAKLETIRAEREHGDRQLEQANRFLSHQVAENTKGLGRASAEVQTVRADLQRALDGMRDEFRSAVREELSAVSRETEGVGQRARKDAASLGDRVAQLEERWTTARGIGIGLGIAQLGTLGGIAAILTKVVG